MELKSKARFFCLKTVTLLTLLKVLKCVFSSIFFTMKCQSNIFRRQGPVTVPGSEIYSTALVAYWVVAYWVVAYWVVAYWVVAYFVVA